ncbi:MAG: hypothetical protein DRH24_15015 [Deltaproteobacteria bacterium]|nr:MAG: hypothetical protein DRH24_15015 [Deltaproteobacteria bacterium]
MFDYLATEFIFFAAPVKYAALLTIVNFTGQADFRGLTLIFFIKTKNNAGLFLYLTLSAYICVNLRLKYLFTLIVSLFALRLSASSGFLGSGILDNLFSKTGKFACKIRYCSVTAVIRVCCSLATVFYLFIIS